ncbi:MAG: hypothetical protein JXB45_03015 [Candidatus Krumholzibacteriota bacterium]|nr:hypothetical protein [Candidatus Krumholzibacteriota bacterium]
MKKILIYTILISMLTTPAAGASFPLEPSDAGKMEIDLDGKVQSFFPEINSESSPVKVGYGASLLEGGTGSSGSGGESFPRSKVREGLASLLLPGWGQHRMGRNTRSKIFFSLDALAWIGAGAFLWQAHAKRNAFEDYAVAFASVQGTGHGDDYYEHLGNYMSSDGPGGYNESVLEEARDLFFPDQNQIDAYYRENMIPAGMAWRWESDKAYHYYNSLREGNSESRRRAVYALFFAMGLRVVSMVDAVKVARDTNAAEAQSGGGISVDIDHQPGGFILSINRSF